MKGVATGAGIARPAQLLSSATFVGQIGILAIVTSETAAATTSVEINAQTETVVTIGVTAEADLIVGIIPAATASMATKCATETIVAIVGVLRHSVGRTRGMRGVTASAAEMVADPDKRSH
ncbi:hypothetical protein [Aurantimonas sp. 22II-16-19i]|uniref:hypothetical protein n=1 Tax=Aurantimonas sp. 22II-16-19i TaxID=1317114 RepID=UPI0009F7ACDC|nr:hypothetical protein [Aurantimonas sp. 22II-16-19i]ORE90716.1 hypothetical protein ATO4_20611 [Aurantimonas sp. 22II-16-19i]